MSLTARVRVGILFRIAKMLKVRVPETIIGSGSREKIGAWCKTRGYRRALVMMDRTVRDLGIAEPVLKSLEREGIECFIYDGVLPNPTLGMAEEAALLGRKNRVEVIVAIGGGSPIDCAKLTAAAITSRKPIEKLVGIFKVDREPLPIIAVPTTAGTGSEVSMGAVISNDATHRKTIMISPLIVPVLAVLDGETMRNLPPFWTASTAFDALTHAIEARTAAKYDAEAAQNACQAVSLIDRYLVRAFENGGDLEARDALSLASYKAGLAMNRCAVGYAHSFGHRLTGFYDVPHGLAVGMFLPHVLEFNRKASQKALAELSVACGLGTFKDKPQVLADRFIERVFELYRQVGLPEKCDKLKRSDYRAIIREAFKETDSTFAVPRYLSKKEAASLLDKVLP